MSRPRSSLVNCLALFRGEALSIGAFSMVTNLMMLAPTLYLLQLYDRVLLSKNELTLYAITLITAMFFLLMAFAEWMRSMAAIRAGVRFDRLLGDRIFESGFSGAHASKIESAQGAMQDLTHIRQFMTGNGLFAFFDLPWTLLYIAILFILDSMLGCLAIAFCAVQAGLAVWNQRSSDQPLQAANEVRVANQRFLDSKIRNIETLHVMGMLPHLYTRWHAIQARWNRLDSDATQVQARNQHTNKFVRHTMQSLMLGAAAWLAIKGQISIGAMIASNVLIARALQPFDVIVTTWRSFIQAWQAVQRIDPLLASKPDAPSAVAIEDNSISGEITLRDFNVSLQEGGKTLLKDINLVIQPGRVLVVMGPSGSGKTTLARALVGLCQGHGGELLVDGRRMSQIPYDLLSRNIGYLPQDVGLIEGSVVENIARFNQPRTLDVIEAAKAAGIHESILRLPLGYDTQVRDNSPMLSGGQRQMIGLARAFYQKPSILVLDEPNSHLDEQGEASLANALTLMKAQGKSIVIVSHRHSILKIADRLLVMQNGEITHDSSRDESADGNAQVHETHTPQAA